MNGAPVKVPNFDRIASAAAMLDKRISAASVVDGVILRQGSTLRPEPVSWLWQHWLARGKFHVLAGPPGQGKTTIALAFAAVCSMGGRWPDGTVCQQGNVLIWSGEDDPADTLAPRLLAMGAEMSRIYFVEGTRIEGKVEPFDPARDLSAITAEADRIGNVALLLVDPVVSAVGGDSHNNGDVRRGLQPLVEVASTLGAAALGISHFTKGSTGRDPVERVTGSLAFGALARVVLCAVKCKSDEGEERRILARAKSNIGPDDGGFAYGIGQVTVPGYPDIEASVIEWGQPLAGTARDLLAEAEADPEADERTDVEGFLSGLLAEGPMPAKAVISKGSGAGYSRDQLQRAARRLCVERSKLGMSGGWVWALPSLEDGTKVVKVAALRSLPTSTPSGLPSTDSEDF